MCKKFNNEKANREILLENLFL